MLIKSNMIYGKVYQKTTFGELANMAAVWLFQGVENRVGKLFSEKLPKKATENQQSTFHPFFFASAVLREGNVSIWWGDITRIP